MPQTTINTLGDIERLTIEDITWWIIAHSDDKQAMDKINKTSFFYTQKYEDFVARVNSNEQ